MYGSGLHLQSTAVLRESVVHPASLTFKVSESVSLEEAAMVEPMAIGMYAATKAQIQPGDVALVLGAGTIGIVLLRLLF